MGANNCAENKIFSAIQPKIFINSVHSRIFQKNPKGFSKKLKGFKKKTQGFSKKTQGFSKKLKDFPKKLKVPEDFPYLIPQKSVIKKSLL